MRLVLRNNGQPALDFIPGKKRYKACPIHFARRSESQQFTDGGNEINGADRVATSFRASPGPIGVIDHERDLKQLRIQRMAMLGE